MKNLKKIIQFIIALACIIYIVRFFAQNKESLKLVLKLNAVTIFLVVIATIAYFFIYSLRTQIVLEKCSRKKLNYIYLFKLMVLARFLNTVFSQMGNVYRGYRLKKEYDISYTSYISSFVSTLWMDTCFNLYFATVLILILSPEFKIGYFTAWTIFLVIALCVSAVPPAGNMLLGKIKIETKFLNWAHSKLTEVVSVTISNLRDIRYLGSFLLLGVSELILTILGYYILFKGFGIILTFQALLVFYILMSLSLFIAITPGNIGVQEIAFGFIAEQIGIGMGSGIMASIVARIINFFIIFLMGIFFGGIRLLRESKKYPTSEDKAD